MQQCIVSDDHIVQQWSFMCLAALASLPNSAAPEWDWDSIWSLTWRRWNTPALSRTSCHAGQALINSGHVTPARISKDLETIAAEIALQGPPFPYDSVCGFLRVCTEITRKDLRLYKLQFEDKGLSWLVENWNVVHGTTGGFNARMKVECHSLGDVLSLAASLCGLTKCDRILAHSLLPDCFIVNAQLDDARVTPLRAYMHDGKVSSYRPQPAGSMPPESPILDENQKPNALSHKFSSFLERSLANLHAEWEGKDMRSMATPEKIRRSLDVAILALFFQATLRHNGFRDNRKVVQAACDLIVSLHECLIWSSWTPYERCVIIAPLSPLTSGHHAVLAVANTCWETLTTPGDRSGISTHSLPSLANISTSTAHERVHSDTQRFLWEGSEVGILVARSCAFDSLSHYRFTNLSENSSKAYERLYMLRQGSIKSARVSTKETASELLSVKAQQPLRQAQVRAAGLHTGHISRSVSRF